jgi:hypothetical protein
MKYLKIFEEFEGKDYFNDPLYFGCGCCSKCNGEVDCNCCDDCGTTIVDDDEYDKDEWSGGQKSDHDKYIEYLNGLESGRINSIEDLDESKKSGVTASLRKKSKASGISMTILRKVFAKGMQAWNAGHRPGVAQHQWAMGRVNSFITGSGGARKADADLWAKAKKQKN